MAVIALLDCRIGNIRSITAALQFCGASVLLTRDPREIFAADGMVLPGVGSFSHGMKMLTKLDLVEVIKDCAKAGKPALGICLGMQLMLSYSEEFGRNEGLGLVPGGVRKLTNFTSDDVRLPHIGWQNLEISNRYKGNKQILENVTSVDDFYFVHSYVATPEHSEDILAYSNYGGSQFCAAIKHKNLFGCQFHPEKSGASGLKVVRSFIEFCEADLV